MWRRHGKYNNRRLNQWSIITRWRVISVRDVALLIIIDFFPFRERNLGDQMSIRMLRVPKILRRQQGWSCLTRRAYPARFSGALGMTLVRCCAIGDTPESILFYARCALLVQKSCTARLHKINIGNGIRTWRTIRFYIFLRILYRNVKRLIFANFNIIITTIYSPR